jgi:thiamine-monophosphate kinase
VFLVNGSAVHATKLLVEGADFRRDWSDADDVGRKCVAVAVASIEAMGATAVALQVAFAAPPDLTDVWLKGFVSGLRFEAERAEVALTGVELTESKQIAVAVSVVGQTDALEPVRRIGAQIGQHVAMCGRIGWAAAGLAALGRGFRSPKAVVDAQRYPVVPYGAGREAAQAGATSMIAVANGLIPDLDRIAQASDVAIHLETQRFAIPDPVQAVASATGADPMDFILEGGGDYALVGTFPAGSVPRDWQVIGTVQKRATDGLPVTAS